MLTAGFDYAHGVAVVQLMVKLWQHNVHESKSATRSAGHRSSTRSQLLCTAECDVRCAACRLATTDMHVLLKCMYS